MMPQDSFEDLLALGAAAQAGDLCSAGSENHGTLKRMQSLKKDLPQDDDLEHDVDSEHDDLELEDFGAHEFQQLQINDKQQLADFVPSSTPAIAEEDDETAEPTAEELEMWKPRMLRKRNRDRGHGSLDFGDLDEAHTVDLNDFDMESKDMSYEFGLNGALPDDQRSLWSVTRKLKSEESRVFSLGVMGGHYKFTFTNMNTRNSWMGRSAGFVVKLWIVNKELGHSVVRHVHSVDAMTPEINFDFMIGSKDCLNKPMELRVQVISNCKHSTTKARLELFKVKLASSEDLVAVSDHTVPGRCFVVEPGMNAPLSSKKKAASTTLLHTARGARGSHDSFASQRSNLSSMHKGSRIFSLFRSRSGRALSTMAH